MNIMITARYHCFRKLHFYFTEPFKSPALRMSTHGGPLLPTDVDTVERQSERGDDVAAGGGKRLCVGGPRAG